MTHGKDSLTPPFGAARMSRPAEPPEGGSGAADEAAASHAPLGKIGFEKPILEKPGRVRRKPASAFDQWLARGLHQLFDDVTREPVPDELLKLIEDDEKKTGG